MSFGGDRAALDPDDAGKLSFVANYAIGRFLQLHAAVDSAPMRLTPRERECLLWSSEGKTEADIGDILSVSTSTISKHIALGPRSAQCRQQDPCRRRGEEAQRPLTLFP